MLPEHGRKNVLGIDKGVQLFRCVCGVRDRGVTAGACDPSTQEVQAGGSEVQGHPQLYRVQGQPGTPASKM